jgi:uncharacterized protein (TIGR00730 family)
MKRICVFCGSKSGNRPLYAEATLRFGEALVARGCELVFGAGHIGLMGVLADAVLAAGGKAIGVIPQSLVDRELAHRGLTELRVVDTMHQRKALMADLSDAFVALPGGYGTGDELFEILTWAQLGIHTKPIGMLNIAGYFDPMLAWLDHMMREDFLRRKHRKLLLVAEDSDALMNLLQSHRPEAPESKWISDAER